MIYPRFKIRKAASGLNLEQVDPNAQKNAKIDQAGVGIVSKINPLWGALAQVGITASNKIRGDGSSVEKNTAANLIDPFNQFKNNKNGRDWITSFALPGYSAVMKAKRQAEEYEKQRLRGQQIEAGKLNAAGNSAFNTLTFAKGGSLSSSGQDTAVVLGGKTHENGGNAVIDSATGEKVAETEVAELLFTRGQTEQIEQHIRSFDKTNDVTHLLKLGRLTQDIVQNNMVDYSGKYKK